MMYFFAVTNTAVAGGNEWSCLYYYLSCCRCYCVRLAETNHKTAQPWGAAVWRVCQDHMHPARLHAGLDTVSVRHRELRHTTPTYCFLRSLALPLLKVRIILCHQLRQVMASLSVLLKETVTVLQREFIGVSQGKCDRNISCLIHTYHGFPVINFDVCLHI